MTQACSSRGAGAPGIGVIFLLPVRSGQFLGVAGRFSGRASRQGGRV